jgi:POT family proton-dependent oligopeptide transporter
VVTLAPVLAAIWVALGKRGKDPSSPAKFAIGLAFCAVAFQLMVIASQRVVASGGSLKVSVFWLIACYMLQGIGELALSPVGLSTMTKLAPRRFAGQLMGVWFTSIALGNLFAGLVGGNVDPERLEAMPQLFQRTALSLLVATVLLVLLIVPIRRMMRERPI